MLCPHAIIIWWSWGTQTKNDDSGFRIYFRVAIFMDNTIVYIRKYGRWRETWNFVQPSFRFDIHLIFECKKKLTLNITSFIFWVTVKKNYVIIYTLLQSLTKYISTFPFWCIWHSTKLNERLNAQFGSFAASWNWNLVFN